MIEYISKSVAVARVQWLMSSDYSRRGTSDYNCGIKDAIEAIEKIPAEKLRDENNKKIGEWKINPDGYYPYCSECQREPQGREMTDFCPNCGADMKGRKNEV